MIFAGLSSGLINGQQCIQIRSHMSERTRLTFLCNEEGAADLSEYR